MPLAGDAEHRIRVYHAHTDQEAAAYFDGMGLRLSPDKTVVTQDRVEGYFKSLNNWGRWGDDDEIGTLNLITDAVVRAAAATVRSGRRVPLALPLRRDGVQTGSIPGRVNPLHTMVQINQPLFGPGSVATSDDTVTMGLQAATHWDALPHVSHSGVIYNGRPADTITAHGGARFSGIGTAASVVSRGVLLDAADQPVEHHQHPLRERPRGDDAILRALEARGRDHLHRLGDLLRRLDRADPATQVDKRRHYATAAA